MTKRLLAVLAAVVIAAMVMILAYTLGSPGVSRSVSKRPSKPDTSNLHLPEGLGDKGGTPPRPGDKTNPVQGADKGTYSAVNGQRRTVLTWDRMKQLPHGVSDVWNPRATITFAPSRAMTVRADRGTFIAPGNHPRSGELRGHVVVALYQGRDGSAVDPATPAGRRVRITLDRAQFDLELGQLDATGPVGVVGSGVTFRGRGLSLRYSQATNRLERLVVAHGDTLTYTPGPGAPAADLRGAPPSSAASPDHPPKGAGRSAPTPQFYRARFEDQVHVDAPRARTTMDAQYLEAVFSLDAHDLTHRAAKNPKAQAPNAKPSAGKPPAAAPAPAPTSADDSSSKADQPATGRRSPASPRVTVHWSGKLVIAPEPTPPADLAGARDVMLRLTGTGRRVHIASHGNQTLDAREVDYLASAQRLTAVGRPDAPLVIKAPRLGTLTGTRLVLNQAEDTGVVRGPGTLLGVQGDRPFSVAWADRLDLSFAPAPAAGNPSGNAPGNSPAGGPSLTPRALGPLREAHFTSDVIARRGRFALDAGEAVLTFLPGPHGKPYPRQLTASGDVRASRPDLQLAAQRLTARFTPPGDKPKQSAQDAERATADASPPSARSPADLADIAAGPGSDSAGAPSPDENPDADRAVSPAPIRSFTAEDHVRVTLADRGIELTGNRLTAAPGAGTMNLYADGDQPALITRGPSTLAARQRITLSRLDQRLHVLGAGWFQSPLPNPPAAGDAGGAKDVKDAGDGEARAEQAGAGDESAAPDHDRPGPNPATLKVTWQDAMDFDNPAASARFVGKVDAQTHAPSQASRLTAHQLELHFSKPAKPAKRVSNPPGSGAGEAKTPVAAGTPAQPAHDPPDEASPHRAIRDATATGHVVFAARTFDQAHPLLTGVRLAGPTMVFQNHPAAEGHRSGSSKTSGAGSGTDTEARPVRQVRVLGKGTLLLQDHRPAPAAAQSAKNHAADRPAPEGDRRAGGSGSSGSSEGSGDSGGSGGPGGPGGATFTGRGDTLFTWAGRLTLDAAGNDMTLEKSVWMIHRPGPKQSGLKPITLDCQHLLVDLEGGGGLGAWTQDRGPEARVHRIVADRGVRAAQGGRSVTADHMTYAADDRVLRFTAEDHNLVTLRQRGQPTAGRAEKVLWYLKPNRLEAIHPAGGVIPLPANP